MEGLLLEALAHEQVRDRARRAEAARLARNARRRRRMSPAWVRVLAGSTAWWHPRA